MSATPSAKEPGNALSSTQHQPLLPLQAVKCASHAATTIKVAAKPALWVGDPGRPTKQQRRAALYLIRWTMRRQAQERRSDAGNGFFHYRSHMTGRSLGEVSLASILCLITDDQRDRLQARAFRIGRAKITRGSRTLLRELGEA